MIKNIALRIGAASLAIIGAVACAQDAASSPAPHAVGVSASTAMRAQAKAASSADTGTLVRTGPSTEHAAEHATRRAAGHVPAAHHHSRRARAAASAASE